MTNLCDVIPEPDDLLILKQDVDVVLRWMETCQRGDVLVITQESPGCGVSTMLRSLERSLSSEIVFHIDSPIGHGLRTVLGQKKIIMIDPLDEYLLDQAKNQRISSLFDTRPLPIIIAGIHRRVSRAKIDDSFSTVRARAGVTRLHINAPTLERASTFLKKTGMSKDSIESVWKESCGDFRHCLASNSMPDMPDSRVATQFVRESIPDGLQALRVLLDTPSQTYPESVRMVDGDINLLIDGVFENYTDGIGNLEAAGGILDVLTTADALQAYVYHDPSSEFPEISGALAGIQWLPCVVKGNSITKHGTVWAKENHKHTKTKLYRQITSRGVHPETIAYIRSIGCSGQVIETANLIHAYGEKTVWNATRLWMKTATVARYTKARHEEMKRTAARVHGTPVLPS